MSMEQDITLWRRLADEAKSGQLFLDDSVAKGCKTAIDDQIDVYVEALNGIEAMSNVTGLGEFECGKELARLLGLKAVDPAGDGDLATSLRDHIEVLKLMGDTIQVTLDRLQDQDSTNSQGYNGV
ncbi:hypothetical protein [Nocardia cyriacigeorgica]|uniref:hypothetical protein n=1 Tax=Nocardia cyriacigeorgica TaxID=135487 RepID=UPI002490109C|nr:hypothetical protein [Nocardia cyriacigeorgica]BDU09235.1 hypothetical protein FMUBM48_54980 [Nocardia cyriacigeorgica]